MAGAFLRPWLQRTSLWRTRTSPRTWSERLGRVLISAQIAALLVAEFVQKSACLSKKQQLTPRPFSRCDFRLRQARFHSEERPMEGRKLYDLFKATEPPREWFPELLLHARKI